MFKRFIFQFIFEWEQLVPKWNWYTFTPIMIEFEYDKMTEGLELVVILLGIGFRLRYNLPASDKIFAKWEKEVDKLTS